MKVALYGIKNGLQTLYSLLRDDIYVSSICIKKWEKSYAILSKQPILYDEIKSNPSEWKVIIAPNDLAKIELEKMEKDGITAEIYDKELAHRLYIADLEIDSLSICFFLKQNKDRLVYIYGTDDRAREFSKKMELLDFNLVGFVTDNKNDNEELLNKTVFSIYELRLMKNNPMIVISRPTKERIALLNRLGFKYGKNYCILSSLRINERRGNRDAIWDLTLGHSYLDNVEIKGFAKYGADNALKKIVILGGSTSDPYYTWFESWPELLEKKFSLEGYRIQIYNGAMCGYNVQQELFKLIRDVIQLGPDLVIDFSGTNNVGTARVSPEHPFVPYYMLDIAERFSDNSIKYSKQTEDMKALFSPAKNSIFFGNETQKSCADSYIETIRMMYVICREFGINFISFLQPSLWTKYSYWNKWEENIVFCSSVSDMKGDLTDFRLNRALEFVNTVSEKMEKYQIDFTSVLNCVEDAYMDTDHYTLTANEIIASLVFQYLVKNEYI